MTTTNSRSHRHIPGIRTPCRCPRCSHCRRSARPAASTSRPPCVLRLSREENSCSLSAVGRCNQPRSTSTRVSLIVASTLPAPGLLRQGDGRCVVSPRTENGSIKSQERLQGVNVTIVVCGELCFSKRSWRLVQVKQGVTLVKRAWPQPLCFSFTIRRKHRPANLCCFRFRARNVQCEKRLMRAYSQTM